MLVEVLRRNNMIFFLFERFKEIMSAYFVNVLVIFEKNKAEYCIIRQLKRSLFDDTL